MSVTDTVGCMLCPRECGADRINDTGYCLVGRDPVVSRAALHMWEEPCISGENGSGAVFFAGCNMGCVFCQNYDISRGRIGKAITADRLTQIYHELEDKGANNINLVTADIFLPVIRQTIIQAKAEGVRIPFVLNTSSYIGVDALKSMEGLIDIYLADMKYIRDEDAVRYSRAKGYVEVAGAAIDEMVRQQPECILDDRGVMLRGVMVRHMLMPGMLIQAKLITRYLYKRYGDRIYISLMNQYTPNGHLKDYPEIDRRVGDREYRSLVRYAQDMGVVNAYIQTEDTADAAYIPDFDLTGVESGDQIQGLYLSGIKT